MGNNTKQELKALNLLQNFVEKFLDSDIKNLENFSFWEIDGHKDFGNGLSYSDGDCTKIAYAIDYLLYHEQLENYSTKYFANGLFYNYSGDTICTFNSLFGSTKAIQDRVFMMLNLSAEERKTVINEENNKYGDDFYHFYQRVGNFYLLPKRTIKIDNKNYSLNTYRGCFQNDYFDIFLQMLKGALSSPNSIDKNFVELINANNLFFENKDINKICETFYLPKDFKLSGENCHYVHWILTPENSSSYKTFAMNYICKSKELIRNRSKKIVETLIKKYPELSK